MINKTNWTDFSSVDGGNALATMNRVLPPWISLLLVIAIGWQVANIVWSTVMAYNSENVDGTPTSIADFFDTEKFPGKRGLRKSAKATLEMALHQLTAESNLSLLVTRKSEIIGILRLADVFAAVYHTMKESESLQGNGEAG